MVCHWIGRLTPSAFVSTYHTIAALLFPTVAMIKKTKMNCPFPGCALMQEHKDAENPHTDEWTYLSQLQLLTTPMENGVKLRYKERFYHLNNIFMNT